MGMETLLYLISIKKISLETQQGSLAVLYQRIRFECHYLIKEVFRNLKHVFEPQPNVCMKVDGSHFENLSS